MKKFSFIGLLLVSMIYAGCEKLPAIDGNSTLNLYYYPDADYCLWFTTQNTAVFRDWGEDYYNSVQLNDNKDFNGNSLAGSYNKNVGTIVFKNLKPSTTYYYRYIDKDELGGCKTGPAISFQTKDENYNLVSAREDPDNTGWSDYSYYQKYNKYFLTVKYSIDSKNYPSDYNYGYLLSCKGRLFYTLSSENNSETHFVDNSNRDELTFSLDFDSAVSGTLTYWVKIYGYVGYEQQITDTSDDDIVFKSETKTIDIPKY
ncbi:hypothetical protein [Prevotella sp. P6B1]|uniref:hypothetical protein n=1 Tax=Prevotella sp. P6B1 TaxID=1410613 RepID=UPI00051C0498|nr:hypothetical protein [Prevotella sp. P6B1]